MNNQETIQNELTNLNSQLPLPATEPAFAVPEGYFDSLAAAVLAKIKNDEAAASEEIAQLSPLLAEIPRGPLYSLPASYFDQNIEGLGGIMTNSTSPLLESISKEMPFSVPQNYFSTLPEQIMGKAGKPEAKIIPLLRRGWMRAAVAAVVGGLLFVFGYPYFEGKNSSLVAQGPADTSSQNLIARNEPAMVQEIKKVSTKELDEFIQNAQVAPSRISKKEPVATTNEQVKNLLKDVSDGDVNAFLNGLTTDDADLAITD